MRLEELYAKIGDFKLANERFENQTDLIDRYVRKVPSNVLPVTDKFMKDIKEKCYAQSFNDLCILAGEFETVGIDYNISYIYLMREVLYLLNFHLTSDKDEVDLFRIVCDYYWVPKERSESLTTFDYEYYAGHVKKTVDEIVDNIEKYIEKSDAEIKQEALKIELANKVEMKATSEAHIEEKVAEKPGAVQNKQIHEETKDEVTQIAE